MTAIFICTLQIISERIGNQTIHIYTDSLAAIKALGAYKVESKMVMEGIGALIEASQHNDITIIWTPAHSNIMGNERADLLAKRGAKLVAYGPKPFFPITEKRCRAVCDKWMSDTIVKRWAVTSHATHTKEFILTPSVRLSERFLQMKKLDLSITTGILTGHIRLNKHLNRIGVRDDPDCDYCGRAEESGRHFLCECTALSRTRKEIYNKGFLLPSEVLSSQLTKITSFAKRSGRFPSMEVDQINNQILNRQGTRRLAINVDMAGRPLSQQQTNG